LINYNYFNINFYDKLIFFSYPIINMTKFAMFVKKHYPKVAHLPAKDRMKALSVMYKKAKGGELEGGGILSGVLGSLGLGLDTEQGGVVSGAGLKKRRAPRKAARKAKGGGILSDVVGAFGL
jgi:hypothetical protein